MKFISTHSIILLFFCLACSHSKQGFIVEESHKDLVLVNGILKFEASPFSGCLVSHFSNGSLKSEIQYMDGKKQGYEKRWFVNGDLAMERFYEKGLKSGIHRAWWETGKLKFEYHFNNKGEFHGAVKEWSPAGQLYMSFNYENGKEAGSQRLWKADGSIKANFEVVNGERFGLIGLKKCYTVSVNTDEVR